MTTPFITDGSDRSAQDLRFWYYGGVSAGEKEYLRQCYIAGINAYQVLQHVQAGASGGGSAGAVNLARPSGDWFFPLGQQVPGTVAAVSGTLDVLPWICDGNYSINAVQVDITVAGVGATYNPVLYDDLGGHPNNLVWDGGPLISCAATGTIVGNVATPVALQAGKIYWVGGMVLNNSATLRAVTSTIDLPFSIPVRNGTPPASYTTAIASIRALGLASIPPTFPGTAIPYSGTATAVIRQAWKVA